MKDPWIVGSGRGTSLLLVNGQPVIAGFYFWGSERGKPVAETIGNENCIIFYYDFFAIVVVSPRLKLFYVVKAIKLLLYVVISDRIVSTKEILHQAVTNFVIVWNE